MRRREFVTLLGGVAAWPLAARAQQPARPMVGFLGSETPDQYASRLRMFHRGLGEMGFVEGRNVAIDYRFAEGQLDNMTALAKDLVRRQVAVIAASSTVAAVAARAATTTIPIVFAIATDPVALGLVASLAHPGGNATGATNLIVEVAPKRLELLHELNATATNAALLVNPMGPNATNLSRDLQAAAKTLGLRLNVVRASSERDFDAVFEALATMRSGGLVIGADPLFNIQSAQLAALALRHRIPTISQYREFAAAGGLMSYGSEIADNYRVVGELKGEKPADLPVQQATRVELILNMKTAKTLGITFPLTLLGRADEVIE